MHFDPSYELINSSKVITFILNGDVLRKKKWKTGLGARGVAKGVDDAKQEGVERAVESPLETEQIIQRDGTSWSIVDAREHSVRRRWSGNVQKRYGTIAGLTVRGYGIGIACNYSEEKFFTDRRYKLSWLRGYNGTARHNLNLGNFVHSEESVRMFLKKAESYCMSTIIVRQSPLYSDKQSKRRGAPSLFKLLQVYRGVVVKPPPWKPAGASVPTPHTGWHPLSCARPPRLAGASRGTYWTPDRVITSSHVTSRVWRGGPVCRSAGSFVVGSAAASGISSNSQDCQQRHGKLPASLPLLPSGPFSCSSQALCRLSPSSASCHQSFVSDEHAAAK
ncbi:hypothetical protein SISNIDRAFT_505647 [Sistotremastrum niveocremeum HHB9708]|uniref:Uncharacterized protein n=1 Tax=Sistotremastrum niveocremeum HHB9708 TaxID=1314777 RepID=A0A164UX34_9AGAM|nr:hypothetical protein SISNIDRAFT_505647 [Sistotremastrum niveocremeum HHB9708]